MKASPDQKNARVSILIGVSGVLFGGLVSLLVKTYFVDRPSVSAEAVSISRAISSNAKVSLTQEADLKFLMAYAPFHHAEAAFAARDYEEIDLPADLRRILRFRPYYGGGKGLLMPASVFDLTIDDVKQLLTVASLSAETILEQEGTTNEDISRLKAYRDSVAAAAKDGDPAVASQPLPLGPLGSMEPRIPTLSPGVEATLLMLDDQIANAEDYIAELKKLPGKIKTARDSLTRMENEFSRDFAYYRITVIITNAGRRGVSIIGPAILHIEGADGRSTSLKLELENQNLATFVGPDQSTSILLVSGASKSLADTDRNFLNSLWTTSGRAQVIMETSNGSTLRSNVVPFADNQQRDEIYRRLLDKIDGT